MPESSRSSRLVVAAAVLDSLTTPTSMLCTARSYPAEHAGQYELPGGKVEPGELPVQALARELAEEIGLEVRLGAEVLPPTDLAVPSPEHEPQPGDDAPAWPVLHGYRMRVWLAEPHDPARGPRRGASHESVHWTSLDDVEALPWLPADLPILRAVRTTLAPAATAGTKPVETSGALPIVPGQRAQVDAETSDADCF